MLVLKRTAKQPDLQAGSGSSSPDMLTGDNEEAILLPEASAELTVKKSVFRAEVFYTDNAQTAKEIVKRQKTRYRDARHVVHAFVIGETGAVLGCSDDGEPAGTAGQPVLAVLKGSGITDILVTVTRECSYEDHTPLLRAAASLPVTFAHTEFAQTVRLSGSIPLAYRDNFAQLVTEITKGASSVHFSE